MLQDHNPTIDDAMASHILWKLQLRRWASGQGGKMDNLSARSTHMCTLGHWIETEGGRYKGMPAYEALIKNHEAFHRWAGEIVLRAEGGDKIGALITVESEFEAKSRQIIDAFAQLKKNTTPA